MGDAYVASSTLGSYMPYPIPEDLENIEGWRWYLVPLPDNDEMIRVAWGMWSELTNDFMWGLEGIVPVQSALAAQIWSNAIYEAFRVMDMGFPDVLLTHIDEVEDLLRALQQNQIMPVCCDQIAAVEDDIQTGVVPDVGDPPETWGDEPVSDWEEWQQLACGAVHLVIDEVIDKLDQMNTWASIGFVTVGAVAALLGALGAAGIVALSITGLGLTGAFLALTNGLSTWSFSAIALDVEDAREEIACALFYGPTEFSQAIEDATGAAWAFFQFYNWSNVRNAILEGQYNDDDLVAAPNDTCLCSGVDVVAVQGTKTANKPAVFDSVLVVRPGVPPPLTNADYERVWSEFRVAGTSTLKNVVIYGITFTSPAPNNDQVGNTFQFRDEDDVLVWNADALPSFPITAAKIVMTDERDDSDDAVAYTATVSWDYS